MNKHFSLSICAIFKDEAPYLREWIEFHRIVGVQHFYLYNNDSSDDYKDQLSCYDEDVVTLIDFPGQLKQVEAYNHLLINFGNETDWVAMIDIDEFIVPKDGLTIQECIKKILDRATEKSKILDFPLEAISGIQLSWLYFGTSFHQNKPDGLVIENYINRISIEANNSWNKMIYYAPNITHIDNPHFTDEKGKLPINENGELVFGFSARPFETHAKFLYINHYYSKSLSELLKKLNRSVVFGPEMTQNKKNKTIYDCQYAYNEVYDSTMLRYVPAIKNRLKNLI